MQERAEETVVREKVGDQGSSSQIRTHIPLEMPTYHSISQLFWTTHIAMQNYHFPFFPKIENQTSMSNAYSQEVCTEGFVDVKSTLSR